VQGARVSVGKGLAAAGLFSVVPLVSDGEQIQAGTALFAGGALR